MRAATFDDLVRAKDIQGWGCFQQEGGHPAAIESDDVGKKHRHAVSHGRLPAHAHV